MWLTAVMIRADVGDHHQRIVEVSEASPLLAVELASVPLANDTEPLHVSERMLHRGAIPSMDLHDITQHAALSKCADQ